MFLFHRLAQRVGDGDAVLCDDGDLAVVQIRHVAGVRDQRGDVRGDEATALAIAQQQRRILARGNKPIRLVRADHAEGIGALDAVKQAVHGVEDVAAVVEVIFQQLGDDLRVGVRAEAHALCQQKFLDLQIVFDDAVMDDGHAAVLADVGMGVDVVRLAVRGPAGVPQADAALDGPAALDQVAQHLQAALGFLHLQHVLRRNDGNARRVVPAIFQPCQPVQQDGRGLFCANITNNTAHKLKGSPFRRGRAPASVGGRRHDCCIPHGTARSGADQYQKIIPDTAARFNRKTAAHPGFAKIFPRFMRRPGPPAAAFPKADTNFHNIFISNLNRL